MPGEPRVSPTGTKLGSTMPGVSYGASSARVPPVDSLLVLLLVGVLCSLLA